MLGSSDVTRPREPSPDGVSPYHLAKERPCLCV